MIESVADRSPFFCVLETSSHALVVGVGKGVGCAQHSSHEREPPYLMAVAPEPAVASDFCTFLSGGQVSEVPARYCFAWPEVRRIVTFFVSSSGGRDPALLWEEI